MFVIQVDGLIEGVVMKEEEKKWEEGVGKERRRLEREKKREGVGEWGVGQGRAFPQVTGKPYFLKGRGKLERRWRKDEGGKEFAVGDGKGKRGGN